METRLIFDTFFLKVWSTTKSTVNGDVSFMTFQWFGSMFKSNLEDVRMAHSKAIHIAQQKNVSTYIADLREAKDALPEDVQKWWVGFLPKLRARGVTDIISVHSPKAKAIDKLVNKEGWEKQTSAFDIRLHGTDDLGKAINKATGLDK